MSPSMSRPWQLLAVAGAALAATLSAAFLTTAAQAAPVPGMGTWQHTLAARNAQGHAVALDSADAVFLYDTVLDVTWLRQASVPATLDWAAATAWAGALQVAGLDGWRLPRTLDVGAPGCTRVTYQGGDCGYNVPVLGPGGVGELAHLFQVTLGNLATYTPDGVARGNAGEGQTWGLVNTASFSGFQAGPYWTSTSPVPGWAYSYDTRFGLQSLLDKPRQHQVLVLRDGDVLSAVPEPATALLFAGAGLAWCGRRLARRRAAAPAGRLLPALALAALAAANPAQTQAQVQAQAAAEATVAAAQIARGRYLVKIGGCNDCHTAGYAQSEGRTPESDWLQGDHVGWQGPWGTTYASNLRLHFSRLTEAQWVQQARSLQSRPPMPAFVLRQMDEGDLRAIHAYIRAAGPAGQPAPAALPPGAAARGPVVRYPG